LKAAELLAEHGYVVYSVDGGMQAWRTLHPPGAVPDVEGPPQKDPGTPGHTPAPEKPSPRENKDRHLPEKFFDSGMGC
jgi:hypothetical protein